MARVESKLRLYILVVSLAMLSQAVLLFALSRPETVTPFRPLSELSSEHGRWSMASVGVVEQEVLDVLQADDVMSRVYRNGETGRLASLFVAYFKTQRTGQAPHSPKNCLPGAGWVPSASDVLAIPIQGLAEPIRVNRYTVSRGDESSIVLYWYQTPTRVIASEYEAKFFLVLDSVRYRRSDTALVRIVAPVLGGDEQAAAQTAVGFVQAAFVPLRQHLPM